MSQQLRCAYEYTVKRGDSFFSIAQRLGVPLRDLLAANESIPPSRLTVGDVLCIPDMDDAKKPAQEQMPDMQPEEGEPDEEPETDGDTSQEETEDDEQEEQAPENGAEMEDENEEEEEQELCPPTRRTVVQQGQTASDLQIKYDLSYYTLQKANDTADLDQIKAGDVVCVPSFNVPCPLPETILLGAGDTLESVALSYNLPISSLLRANPCLSPADFVEGAQIKLPK